MWVEHISSQVIPFFYKLLMEQTPDGQAVLRTTLLAGLATASRNAHFVRPLGGALSTVEVVRVSHVGFSGEVVETQHCETRRNNRRQQTSGKLAAGRVDKAGRCANEADPHRCWCRR
jgi:hypothetical protein